MSKNANQKLKILYLMNIFTEHTDETHHLTISQIIKILSNYNISSERKSLYDDIETLRFFGMDINKTQIGKNHYYYLASKHFELAELKLLVDAVQSSKFITEKKTNELIKKLEELCSKYEATQLQREVFVSERVKTSNESIYYNVDEIHSAINNNSKIRFKYFYINEKKEVIFKRNGAFYEVSPWALSWYNSNYYLIAYDTDENLIKHFRVDKMKNISKTETPREGKEHFKNFDIASYTKSVFSMFGGEPEYVKLLCHNSMAGIIIDRFGKDVILVPNSESTFTTNIKVVVSTHFLAWVIGLGENVRIIGPDHVLEQVNQLIDTLIKQYR